MACKVTDVNPIYLLPYSIYSVRDRAARRERGRMTDPTKPAMPQTEREAPRGLMLVPGTRHRLSDQLYRQLLEQIVDGRLRNGERLPSENAISARFGVSRPIVRDALLRLRLEGHLHARQGSGTYVTRQNSNLRPQPPSAEQMAAFLRCVEVRLAVEATAARLAAQRRTTEQLATLMAVHDAYYRSMDQGEQLYGSDLAFHLAVADASGNPQFADVLRHVETPATGSRSLSLALARASGRDKELQVWSEHGHVVDAIRAGDPEGAQVAMQFHLNQIRRRMLDEFRVQ
jgi:GntR family transcriptional repressor for pyruvate dehydrogenase complex